MTVSEEIDGNLVVTHDSTLWTKWLFAIAGVFAATGVYDLVIGTRGSDRLIGLLGAVAVCASSGLLFLERMRFTFDPRARTITWRRRWAWWCREGSLSFESVKDVDVQIPLGDEGVPSRRISLQLRDGSELSLTAGYSPDGDDSIIRLAMRIREVLGHLPRNESPAAVAAALARAGRTIDAIRLLRQEEDLSLEEAKRRVDHLKSQPQ